MKKKSIAALLAMMLGPYGLHRFYLGQRALGIVYLVIGTFLTMVTIIEGEPAILIAALIALIDAILFAVMPQEEFDAKYNKNSYYSYQGNRERSSFEQRRKTKENQNNYDYLSIIEDLKEDLEDDFQQPKTHFHLACCYSRLEKDQAAFFHLEKAITFGFVDFAVIHHHDDLSYLRTLPEFKDFVLNGYKNIVQLPVSEENILAKVAVADDHEVENQEGLNLLDQIVLLGELREKGILTEEEFYAQKSRLLR